MLSVNWLVASIIVLVLIVIVVSVVIIKRRGEPEATPEPTITPPSELPGEVPIDSPIEAPAATWAHTEDNLVAGLVVPKSDNTDGLAYYFGETESQAACEAACEQRPGCTAYTWHIDNGSAYAKLCYGMDTVTRRAPGGAHRSGERVEGFSNTLMRRVGALDRSSA